MPLNGERPAREFAGGGIALGDVAAGRGGMAVDQSFAFRAEVTLIRGCLRHLRWPAAKRGAGHRPVTVGLALEIIEPDVRARARRAGRNVLGATFQKEQPGLTD